MAVVEFLCPSLQDTLRTLVLSGRPLRLIPNDWVQSWEKAARFARVLSVLPAMKRKSL